MNLAAKAAGHELRAVNAYFALNIADLRVPWQVLVEYCGYRVIAMPFLPLSRLVVGSNDAGKTVHVDCTEANSIMSATARMLHLAPHRVNAQLMHCAGDCEGHVGTHTPQYQNSYQQRPNAHKRSQ